MKKFLVFLCAVMLVLGVAGMASALDFDFEGNIAYHNDVLSWSVTTDASAVTVFTSSWDDGNFDPMLGVWDSAVTCCIIKMTVLISDQLSQTGYYTITVTGIHTTLLIWEQALIR
jgi:hypothetical protein